VSTRRLVFLGLSITSSWGNGHATNYRALLKALHAAGHSCLFLERDTEWYADNRDMPRPRFCEAKIYRSLAELRQRFGAAVREADAVIVGSYVPDGAAVGEWAVSNARGVKAFWDIDTPVTLAKLARGDHEYLSPDLIPRYDLYLSFTGGPTLERLRRRYGAPLAAPFYCMVDPALYQPLETDPDVDLGYLGTYSADRQPALERLLIEPARRHPLGVFAVAGPQYPEEIQWPDNVRRIEHCPPDEHREFYTSQRFTLNITRRDMVRAGYSPSVRLFEAAACGTPIISDLWPGLETVLKPGEEVIVARGSADVLHALREMPERSRLAVARRARARVLAEHTAAHRATELLGWLDRAHREGAAPGAVDGSRVRVSRARPRARAGRRETRRRAARAGGARR
jgi:spore maturation protein CgeB